ncbi:MAG: cobalamin-dependent protein [Fimbriimonadaceae bacterium]|nr:cobalamin-dependent protein [Alphaproteobacteria bacterium]
MNTKRFIKVIVTVIGLDGHNTGAEIIARILRDAGIEVVYLGINQTPEMILSAAIQEDVDLIGISSHASNFSQIEQLVQMLEDQGMGDVPVVCGGNIPAYKIPEMKAQGVAEIFPPGAASKEIVDYIYANARDKNVEFA